MKWQEPFLTAGLVYHIAICQVIGQGAPNLYSISRSLVFYVAKTFLWFEPEFVY